MLYNDNKRKKMQNKMIFNSVNKFNIHPNFESKEYCNIIYQNQNLFDKNEDLNKDSDIKSSNINSIEINKKDSDNNELNLGNNDELNSSNNIIVNKNINEENNLNKEKLLNHKVIPLCINNCISWTLKAYINNQNYNKKEIKSNYIFKGKNIFFPNLEFSILNAFNNNLCFDKCFPKNKSIFENKKKILEKIKKESFRQLDELNESKKEDNKNSENASLTSIIESNYPIDNIKKNFNIIDNNLCLKDNVNNIFLLQFDLKNNIDKNIDFRLINDN